VTTRTTFGQWTLEANGLRYPRLWHVESDGQVDTSTEVTQVRFDVPWNADNFNIPEDVQKQFQQQSKRVDDVQFGSQARPPHELAPGVVKVAAAWDVIEAKQDDGIVIFEGPLSSGYSSRVMEDAKKRFPGLPIKAVITTSDSWPHIGGMREYVAQGIPIYALDLNRPILERLFKAPYRSFPDALAKSPKQPKWNIVSGKTILGAGSNRLVIYPYRTATGERQMMVYLPEHRLLYTSDLFAVNNDGSVWLPGFAQEMIDAVKREGLDVANVVGMHYDMTTWEKVVGAAKVK
jgi:glyoxylase-like metal-dependent hydrolase (beta-lactamase superfamily II)